MVKNDSNAHTLSISSVINKTTKFKSTLKKRCTFTCQGKQYSNPFSQTRIQNTFNLRRLNHNH